MHVDLENNKDANIFLTDTSPAHQKSDFEEDLGVGKIPNSTKLDNEMKWSSILLKFTFQKLYI